MTDGISTSQHCPIYKASPIMLNDKIVWKPERMASTGTTAYFVPNLSVILCIFSIEAFLPDVSAISIPQQPMMALTLLLCTAFMPTKYI